MIDAAGVIRYAEVLEKPGELPDFRSDQVHPGIFCPDYVQHQGLWSDFRSDHVLVSSEQVAGRQVLGFPAADLNLVKVPWMHGRVWKKQDIQLAS